MARKKSRRGKAKRSASKKSSHRKHNPSSKHRGSRRRRRNPESSSSGKSTMSLVKTGVGLVLGKTLVKALAQNLVPAAYRSGLTGSAAVAAVGFGARFLAKKVSALRPYADGLAIGGVIGALESQVEPIALPKLQFNLLGDVGEPGYLGQFDSRALVATGTLGDMGAMDNRYLVAAGAA